MNRFAWFVMMWVLFYTAQFASAGEVKIGTISGTVMIGNDRPMADGRVFFFNDASGPPPSPDRYWRVPDEIAVTDAQGKFTAQLVEGSYFVGAMKRKSGNEIGPPREGDLYLPVYGDKGKLMQVRVEKGSQTDIESNLIVAPFVKPARQLQDGVTAIEGTVRDATGKPVEGVLAFAFLKPSLVGKPLFVSERTGKDGRYMLRVHDGGNYYIKIRETYGGGAPKGGDLVGGYGKDKPLPVTVKSGTTVNGIDITAQRFNGLGFKRR
jgi:hypothetical protein